MLAGAAVVPEPVFFSSPPQPATAKQTSNANRTNFFMVIHLSSFEFQRPIALNRSILTTVGRNL